MRRLLDCLLLAVLAFAAQAASAFPVRQVQDEPYVVKAVASLLVAEAGCDKQPGMLGVAEVIRNRAREKRKTPLAIIQQPGVFSSLIDTDLTTLIRRQTTHPQFASALRLARLLLQDPNRLPNTTRNATHFDNVNRTPFWSLTAKATVTIGNHRFYRAAY